MFHVAMLSKWHVHAGDYARQIQQSPDAEITCVWDEDPSRGEAWAKELGVPFIPDLETLLSRDDVDGVAVDTPTSLHPEVMLAAAAHHKHIFTEKVLALTMKDAGRIAQAVKESGIQFCISYPQRTVPAYLFVKKAVENGIIGSPTMMRVQNGHDGATANWLPEYWYDKESAGGGAMMDLGCHPMYLTRWILGEPKQISSMFAHYTGREVEDSAVCTILFQNGAVGVVESSLAVKACPYQMEIFGTKGSVLIRNEQVSVTAPEYGDQAVTIQPGDLPDPFPSAMEQWIGACCGKGEIIFGIDDAVALTQLMEAAYQADAQQRTITIQK